MSAPEYLFVMDGVLGATDLVLDDFCKKMGIPQFFRKFGLGAERFVQRYDSTHHPVFMSMSEKIGYIQLLIVEHLYQSDFHTHNDLYSESLFWMQDRYGDITLSNGHGYDLINLTVRQSGTIVYCHVWDYRHNPITACKLLQYKQSMLEHETMDKQLIIIKETLDYFGNTKGSILYIAQRPNNSMDIELISSVEGVYNHCIAKNYKLIYMAFFNKKSTYDIHSIARILDIVDIDRYNRGIKRPLTASEYHAMIGTYGDCSAQYWSEKDEFHPSIGIFE